MPYYPALPSARTLLSQFSQNQPPPLPLILPLATFPPTDSPPHPNAWLHIPSFLAVFGTEPQTLPRSLFPDCNSSRTKFAFTTLTSVWLWFSLIHRYHRRKVHMEKIYLFIQKQLRRWYLLWKAVEPSGSESEGVTNTIWMQSIFGPTVRSVLSSPDARIYSLARSNQFPGFSLPICILTW